MCSPFLVELSSGTPPGGKTATPPGGGAFGAKRKNIYCTEYVLYMCTYTQMSSIIL